MTKAIQILLVEDNPADADLTRESLSSSALEINLTVAVNGKDAVDCVHKRGRFATAVTPDLILLDLNLPGIDGRGVLADIKQDLKLKRIPVSILTSSQSERDIAQCYELGANCYVAKPIDFKSFLKIVREVENFWFGVVKLPQAQSDAAAKTASAP